MKIKIYVNNESIVVDLFEVTYEDEEDRFKSLRLSKGTYPKHKNLDFKNEIPEIKNDFYLNEDGYIEVLEMSKFLKYDSDNKLINNWFCFKEGTERKDIAFFLQANGRSYRK